MLPTIHVIDFEGNKKYGILEWGVATLSNGEVTNVMYGRCRSDRGASERDFREHSRFEDEQELKSFGEQIPLFVKLRQTGLLGAHSATTEENLLKMYQFSPGKVPSFLFENSEIPIWGPWIDSCLLAKHFFKVEGGYSLSNLCKTFCLEPEINKIENNFPTSKNYVQFHRARHDAIASAVLLNFIISVNQNTFTL